MRIAQVSGDGDAFINKFDDCRGGIRGRVKYSLTPSTPAASRRPIWYGTASTEGTLSSISVNGPLGKLGSTPSSRGPQMNNRGPSCTPLLISALRAWAFSNFAPTSRALVTPAARKSGNDSRSINVE